jgi:hypothetical protein
MDLRSVPAGSDTYSGAREDKGFTMLTSPCSSCISIDSESSIVTFGEFLDEFTLEYCDVAVASIVSDSRCCRARLSLSSSRFLRCNSDSRFLVI